MSQSPYAVPVPGSYMQHPQSPSLCQKAVATLPSWLQGRSASQQFPCQRQLLHHLLLLLPSLAQLQRLCLPLPLQYLHSSEWQPCCPYQGHWSDPARPQYAGYCMTRSIHQGHSCPAVPYSGPHHQRIYDPGTKHVKSAYQRFRAYFPVRNPVMPR